MGVYDLSGAGSIKTGRTLYTSMNAGNMYGAMVPIASVEATGSSNLLEFLNIPQGFQDLQMIISARSTSNNTSDILNISLNNDSSSLYSYTRLQGDGSSPESNRESNLGFWRQNFSIPAATATAGIFGSNTVHLLNYTNTTTFKSALWRSGSDRNGAGLTILSAHLYRSTNAITRINTSTSNGNFAAGSTATLYGIRAVS